MFVVPTPNIPCSIPIAVFVLWRSMVAGTPAKIVGTLQEDTPSLTMKHGETDLAPLLTVT